MNIEFLSKLTLLIAGGNIHEDCCSGDHVMAQSRFKQLPYLWDCERCDYFETRELSDEYREVK